MGLDELSKMTVPGFVLCISRVDGYWIEVAMDRFGDHLRVKMNKPNSLLADLLELTPAERIQLAEDLWDSVSASPETMPGLTATQLAEIERRLAEQSRDPSTSIPWEEVRARLWSRLG
jgi:putative addiction module component (TIGR02574 family)